ncbi:MAG: cyclopropane-fatty-acyl-phospholipid synthase family protein [Thermoanaerobaculia bacterium]
MYDRTFWDQRYSVDDYIFGTEPNDFLAEHAALLAGPVLSLSEGEGRNAVHLAALGLEVLGVDLSPVALAKAERLAAARGVTIATEVVDLADFEPGSERFGAVVSIFAHLPGPLRQRLYPRIEEALRPGGLLLLESYSENQLGRDTGGPKEIDLLMTVDKLRREFPRLTPVLAREIEREVREGPAHTGLASVVQFLARKEVA